MPYEHALYRFGYFQCMCLSGPSMKTIVLIVFEKLGFKIFFHSKFQGHKGNFPMCFFVFSLRILPTNLPTILPTNLPTNLPTDLPTNLPKNLPAVFWLEKRLF